MKTDRKQPIRKGLEEDGKNRQEEEKMIQERILDLTDYALVTGLINPQDTRYTINRLLELFGLDELEDAVAEAHQTTIKTQEDSKRS